MHLMFDARAPKRSKSTVHVHGGVRVVSKLVSVRPAAVGIDVNKDPLFMVSSKPLKSANVTKKIEGIFGQKEKNNSTSPDASVIEIIDDSEDEDGYNGVNVLVQQENEGPPQVCGSQTRNPTQIYYDSQYIEEASEADYGSEYTDTSETFGPKETSTNMVELRTLDTQASCPTTTPILIPVEMEVGHRNDDPANEEHENSLLTMQGSLKEPQPQKIVTLSIKSTRNNSSSNTAKPSRLKGKPLSQLLNAGGGVRRRVGLSRQSNVDSLHYYLNKRPQA